MPPQRLLSERRGAEAGVGRKAALHGRVRSVASHRPVHGGPLAAHQRRLARRLARWERIAACRGKPPRLSDSAAPGSRRTETGYWAAGIDPGAVRRLSAADLDAAAALLQQTIAANRPANPPKFDPKAFRNAFDMGFAPSRYYYWGWDEQLPEPSVDQGVLETNLSRCSASGLRGLGPRSYVAIVASSSEAPLGFESAREEASLHVVFGRF